MLFPECYEVSKQPLLDKAGGIKIQPRLLQHHRARTHPRAGAGLAAGAGKRVCSSVSSESPSPKVTASIKFQIQFPKESMRENVPLVLRAVIYLFIC